MTMNVYCRVPLFCVISPNSLALGGEPTTSKELKLHPYCLQQGIVFGTVLSVVSFAEITENDCVKERYPLSTAKI